MARIRPFRALCPTAEAASRVASVPYDVVTTAEARALAAGNPDHFLRVSRPEIDFPDGKDPPAAEVYARGRANLAAMRARGVLVQEPEPSLFLYRLAAQGRSQTGLLAAFSTEEYETGLIRRHELTRPDKEEDRMRHMLEVGAQGCPAFLVFRHDHAVAVLTQRATARPPRFDFVAPDGVRHMAWRLDEEAHAWVGAFATIPFLYVADGHHRAAAAARVRDRLAHASYLPPDHPAEGFLAAAFPADEVRILGYHRTVRSLGRSPGDFLAALRRVCEVTAVADPEPAGPGDVRMLLGGAWHRLRLLPTEHDPVRALDVGMLQDQVLGPLLGVEDPRSDPRLDFVGGPGAIAELVRRVASGEAEAAFALAPVGVETLFRVSDAGLTMPPKSTWFEPKLRSGLFTYLLEAS